MTNIVNIGNILSMFNISDTSTGIPIDVLERIEVKDLFSDALRGLGYWIIKGVVKIGDFIYSGINAVLSVDILDTFFATHFDEIKEISKNLLIMTIIIYAIMMLLNSDLLKGMIKQLLLFSLLISSMSYIVTTINGYYTMLGDYATNEISVSDSIFKDIVSENVYLMEESLNVNRLVSLKEYSESIEMAINSTHLQILSATDDEPLNFKVAMIFENGMYMTSSLDKSYWSLGKLNEKVYMYSFDFINIVVLCLCVAVMIFFMLFKIANLMVYGILLPILSPLTVSTDLSGQRSKQLAQTILINFASLFLLLFLFKTYLTMINSLFLIDNFIVKVIYLIALGGVVVGSEKMIASLTGVAPPQEGKLATVLTAMGIRSAMKLPSKMIGGMFNMGRNFISDLGSSSSGSTSNNSGSFHNFNSPTSGNAPSPTNPVGGGSSSANGSNSLGNISNSPSGGGNTLQSTRINNDEGNNDDSVNRTKIDDIIDIDYTERLIDQAEDYTNFSTGNETGNANDDIKTNVNSTKIKDDPMENVTLNKMNDRNKSDSFDDLVDIEELVNESNNRFGNNKGGKNNE